MYIKKTILLLLICVGSMTGARAQHAAVKTNLIDDALLNINLGVEVGLVPKWTLDIPASFNGWEFNDGKRWKHWWVQPGVRYWFCDRFAGHFVGLHTHGGQYNVGGFDGKLNMLGTDFRKLKDTRYQGWFVGAGISYGYAWILNKHWNIEGEIGFGYSYTRYDRFLCTGCGRKVEKDQPHHYVGPTKAAIDLVYLF